MVKEIDVKGRIIGSNQPSFIIAELSANHNQDFQLAVDTIKAAKEAGADAIKLQTYTPDTMTIDCNNDHFIIKGGTVWDGQSLYELYKKAYTPWDWQPKLKKIAEDIGLIFFSTPFDYTAVDFLEEMDVVLYKVSSFEITDIPLIEYIASKNKPMIISTGIATISDINDALAVCKKAKNDQIILFKCTSAYPAPFEEINLRMIPEFEKKFKALVGLSDHSLGCSISIAAVAIGAKVIEKHFTIDRKIGGPDSKFSMEPSEFKQMVTSIREVEKSLGKISYELSEKSKKSRELSARSLFVVKDIKKGGCINENNIRSIRPGYGLLPKFFNKVIGKKVNTDIKRGTPLSWKLFEEVNE